MNMAVAKTMGESEPCAQMSVLNEFHAALQKMVRAVILMVDTSAPRESVEAMLEKIVDCSQTHILDEDRIGSEASCAQCAALNANKQIFLDATIEWVGRFKAAGRTEGLEFLQHLDDWLSDHVAKGHRLCGKL